VRDTEGELPRPAMRIEHLEAWYRDIQVLYGVDLLAKPGEVTAVLGPNGAGKTTLLLAAAGCVTAKGSIYLNETRIDGRSPSSRFLSGLALVQPQRRVFHGLTVQQNLRLVARHLPRKARAEAIAEVVEKFPATKNWLRKPAGDLSGGQQQIAGIAQALVMKPTVLMLDEPSTGLAPQAVDALCDVILRMKNDGIAVVLVEQALHLAMTMGDDITVLGRGRVLQQGPRAGFDSQTISERFFLGISADEPAHLLECLDTGESEHEALNESNGQAR
jgi:branched-chain amino acid transport system ATP-binding protein